MPESTLQDWAIEMAEIARAGGLGGSCAAGALMLFDRKGLADLPDEEISSHVRHWLADHGADGVSHCELAFKAHAG